MNSDLSWGSHRGEHLVISATTIVVEGDLLVKVICVLQVVIQFLFVLWRNQFPTVLVKVDSVDELLILEDNGIVVKNKEIVIGSTHKVKQVLTVKPVGVRVLPVPSHGILVLTCSVCLIFCDNDDAFSEEWLCVLVGFTHSDHFHIVED